jgi:hypothetical protein
MAKVTLHKSSDGKLHDTATLCAKHEICLRVAKAADGTVFSAESFSDDEEGNRILYAGDLTKFIVDNADILRKILNDALVARRPRKAKSDKSAMVAA